MITNNPMNGVEDWLKSTESAIRAAGRVRGAYQDVANPPRAAPVIVQARPVIDLNHTTILFLAAGAVALFAWMRVMK